MVVVYMKPSYEENTRRKRRSPVLPTPPTLVLSLLVLQIATYSKSQYADVVILMVLSSSINDFENVC